MLQSSKPPTVREAMTYIQQIKSTFRNKPEVYSVFEIELARATKGASISDLPNIIRSVYKLLQSDESLLMGFNSFLPPGYKIVILTENNVRLAAYSTPAEPSARYILGKTVAQNPNFENTMPSPVLVEPDDHLKK